MRRYVAESTFRIVISLVEAQQLGGSECERALYLLRIDATQKLLGAFVLWRAEHL